MGKILTYEDIEAEGGTINRATTIPPGESFGKKYEGDTHCPASSDWWRITNVACPYASSEKRCTDTELMTNAFLFKVGYIYGSGTTTDIILSDTVSVTFPDNLNYKIRYSVGASLPMRMSSQGYKDIILQTNSAMKDIYIYPDETDDNYRIDEVTLYFPEEVIGSFGTFYGYYWITGSTYYVGNFKQIGFTHYISPATTTLSFTNLTIPKLTNSLYDGLLVGIGNPSNLKA